MTHASLHNGRCSVELQVPFVSVPNETCNQDGNAGHEKTDDTVKEVIGHVIFYMKDQLRTVSE